MHNLPDGFCVQVLKHTKEATGLESKILIDDIVVPKTGVHWKAAQLDLFVMAALGAVERTREQWERLFKKAGLKIQRQFVYHDVQGDVVMGVAKV